MRFSDILRNLRGVFERKRKNPIQLEQDSNLENNLKFLKVDTKSTPIQISEDTVNINGSLTVNNVDVSTEPDTGTGATELNELSDVTYSSGDLTISSLDTIISGDLKLDSSGDITIDADGGDIGLRDDDVLFVHFNLTDKSHTFYYDSQNYFKILVETDGATTLQSADSNTVGVNADLLIDAGGDFTINSKTGYFIAKYLGTEFSPANGAYAGMILGYRVIGLDEADATYDLTTSYVVPTDEFGVTFTSPPSNKVEISIQFQFNGGSTGAGDCFVGLSTANATSGYSALEDFHEQEIIDFIPRGTIRTIHHSWVVTGLSTNTSYTYYVGFKSSSTSGTPKIQWGSNASGEYPTFIMKVTALPSGILT